MTNIARIAAIQIWNKLPQMQRIQLDRLELVFKNSLIRPRKNYGNCYCPTPETQNIKLPILFPIYPHEGQASKGYYTSIPLAYISWFIPSQALPRIEVLETPIIDDSLIYQNEDKDNLDKFLFPLGKTVIGSFQKLEFPMQLRTLNQIRKRVLSKILEISATNANLFLSIFSEMPKILVEDDNSRYQQELTEAKAQGSWQFQSERLMPVILNNKLCVFKLYCWILTKNNLSI
jgi:hypothetical protein